MSEPEPKPALPPGPVTLTGRFGRVEKLDASKHGADLWAAMQGHPQVWDYMPYGPFDTADAFRQWLDGRQKLADP